MNGDRATVQSLVQQKADVNATQTDGATAIQWAVYRDDVEMAGVLIAAGANIKLANREGATPLYLASLHGSAPMIERLLKAGVDPNQLGPEGETPLMLAARTGNLDAIRVLLDAHADVNAKDKLRGTTALMWAVDQSHPEAVKLLIARGATVGAQTEIDTRNSRNNLANTVKQRLRSSFGVLGKRGPGNDGTPALPEGASSPKAPAGGSTVTSSKAPATQPNGEDEVASFFRRPAKKDGGGLTPLVYAAREDCMECAKALVEAGADVNQRTYYGWTPLLVATQNRHYKLAQYFLEHGANPNTPNNGGWTPLYLATDNRNIESGDYPVRAPDMDHLDFIKLLIAKGANVNARICGVESTPEECTGDSTETRTNFTMQWLFEDGATPFLRAAQSGDVELMKLLIAHGANPKIFTAHNVTPLAVASGIGWVEGVTYEWSPEQNIEAVKMCLDLGIDPNVADDEGRTALHGAAHKGRVEVIQMLVDHGANLVAHDGGSRDSVNGALLGKTWIPIDWARGLVRVGVQSAIPHPEAAALLAKLMTERNIPIPPPPSSSICLTKGLNGCQ
jgi:ankyrin repeat protein